MIWLISVTLEFRSKGKMKQEMWKWWKCTISLYYGVFEMINGWKVLAWILKWANEFAPSTLKFISHVVIFSLFLFFMKWPHYDWQIKYNLINEIRIFNIHCFRYTLEDIVYPPFPTSALPRVQRCEHFFMHFPFVSFGMRKRMCGRNCVKLFFLIKVIWSILTAAIWK